MAARIENEADLAGMRSAGKKAATVLEMIEPHVQPGVTTDDLDRICHDYIVNELQCIPAPLNYGGGGGQVAECLGILLPAAASACSNKSRGLLEGVVLTA